MAFSMNLWKVNGDSIKEIEKHVLGKEELLENWIERDPSILGIDLLIIGRQVTTEYRGRIDLLAMNSDGDVVIVELKRDKTPRDTVAQVLDYASWAKELGYNEINSIASNYLSNTLASAYGKHFGSTLPDTINASHSIIIVASELDDSSERIVQYLSDTYNANINAIFFNFYKIGNKEILGRAWLMDPEEVQDRSVSKKKAPWSGYWYVNVGDGNNRSWDDCRKYGFTGAGHGDWYSSSLKKLNAGYKIFAYQRGVGYIGYGEVTGPAKLLKNFIVEKEGKPLVELPLTAPGAKEHIDDPEMAEWAVPVKWLKTFSMNEAKTFRGVFANQNIVCKLRHEDTINFLIKEFDLPN